MTVLLLGLALLPWVIPTAVAATTAGQTVALVNPEQRVRELSSAIPIFGFGLTADSPEALHSVNVTFTGVGFDAGNDRDLAALSHNSAVSGVGLYRDDGAQDDVLDSGDTPVALDGNVWNGAQVQMDLSSHNESVPMPLVGNFSWFVVIRTSGNAAALQNDNRIVGHIYTNGIIATNAGNLTYQPPSDVTTNTMVVRLTSAFNANPDNYIGPANVEVNKMQVLGLRIVDGGGGVNAGIHDGLTQLQVNLTAVAGTLTASDFAPFSTDGATSGLAVYLDDGSSDDAWDANDTPITLGSISPLAAGLISVDTLTLAFSPPLAVPDDVTGNWDLFLAVRSGTITSGDAFSLQLVPGSVKVSGLLPSDADHSSLFFPSPALPATIRGDDTPPTIAGPAWSESSPYLSAWGNTLYFNHQMATQQNATVSGTLYDAGSGQRNVTWWPQAGLAASPPVSPVARAAGAYRAFSGVYGFNASSTDSGSPIEFTAYDWVGNSVTATAAGFWMNYSHREDALLLQGSPGWYGAGSEMFVGGDGTLYFSDHISSTSSASLQVRAVSLYGGGLKNVSVSNLQTAGGPSNPFDAYAPGVYSATFDTTFDFMANSTQGTGVARVTAVDQSGNSLFEDFQYREDNAPPLIEIKAPSPGSPVTGNLRLRASVSDSGAGVRSVFAGVDPENGSASMYFDGTDYFFDLASGTFTDGPHTLIVTASDNVGNTAATTVNVDFANAVVNTVPPLVALTAPQGGAKLSGTTTITVSASSLSGIASVWVRDGQGAWQEATWNAASSAYALTWDTTTASDGPHWLTAMARDASGTAAQTAPVQVTVDNNAPSASVSGPAPSEVVSGTYTVRVFASDAVGVASVTLTIGERTVDMAYNPSTGYYEYTIDTRTLKDGAQTATAKVTDASGKTTTAEPVAFKVQNSDTWRSLRESTNFLFLLFVVLGSLAVLLWARNGTLHRWMSGEAATGARIKKEEEQDKRTQK